MAKSYILKLFKICNSMPVTYNNFVFFFHFQIKARKKVAVTVLVFVALFAVCFGPFYAFMLFFYFTENAEDHYNAFWHFLRIVGFCLCYANSCANPVALYFVSGAFRKHFDRWVTLFIRKGHLPILLLK